MLVILEGLDNCGKDTLLDKLCMEHNDIIRVDFPDYQSNFGTFIRCQLRTGELPPISLQLLFSGERLSKADYIKKMSAGHLVIANRYSYSVICYGIAREINPELLQILESDMPESDIKIYISISPEESMKRSCNPDLFEKNIVTLRQAEKEYMRIISAEPEWFIIDGMKSPEEVYQCVHGIIFKQREN